MKKSVLKMILIAKQLIRGDKLKYIDMATRKRLVVAFATEVISEMKKKELVSGTNWVLFGYFFQEKYFFILNSKNERVFALKRPSF